MNLYDSAINIEDEDLILSLKGLDLSGWQKMANIIDAIRAVHRINQQSWYFGQATDRNDINEPFVIEYHKFIRSMQQLTSLELKEITPQAIACTSVIVNEYLKLINNTLEASVNSSNNTFTSNVQLARRLQPVIQLVLDSLQDLYDESRYNIPGRLDLEARTLERLQEEDAYFYDLQRQFTYLSVLCKDSPSTAKSLLGANLVKILETSSRFYASRGQTLNTELKDNKI